MPEQTPFVFSLVQWVERGKPAAPAVAPGTAPTTVTSIATQTLQERRLYVGNLAPGTTEEPLVTFLNTCMASCLAGANMPLPEGYTNAVLSAWIAPGQNYAFVEFVTKECAVIAMGLSGISFQGMQLRVSRPNNYQTQSTASVLDASPAALLAAAMGIPAPAAAPDP